MAPLPKVPNHSFMRYHIFHLEPEPCNFYDWDITEDFVIQVVRGFLRGLKDVRINGEGHRIGSDLLIYESHKETGVSKVLMDSMLKFEGTKANFSKDFFERNYENVTDRFIQGRSWGELKEDVFNIYINDGQNKPVILALNDQEVQHFLSKWAVGESPIWVSGRRIDLNDPKSIKIFDISLEWLSKDRGDIRFNIKKYANLVHKGSFKIDALEHFGKEVTDKWNVRPFGNSKAKMSAFDWGIIHSEIYRVAKSRFDTGHFADAVEAAFKEINEIVKKEYKTREGKEEDGTSLMRKAFAHQNPIFKLNDLSTDSLKNIQQGYMDIFAGVMMGIRNPKAHANLEINELDSWEKIVLASHLMKMWDGRVK
jgi:uncharacterized protein (TIGR02391 family)